MLEILKKWEHTYKKYLEVKEKNQFLDIPEWFDIKLIPAFSEVYGILKQIENEWKKISKFRLGDIARELKKILNIEKVEIRTNFLDTTQNGEMISYTKQEFKQIGKYYVALETIRDYIDITKPFLEIFVNDFKVISSKCKKGFLKKQDYLNGSTNEENIELIEFSDEYRAGLNPKTIEDRIIDFSDIKAFMLERSSSELEILSKVFENIYKTNEKCSIEQVK